MPSVTPDRPWAKLYDRKWRKRRYLYLCRNPFCVMCKAQGLLVTASVVDHKVPHKGDLSLFTNEHNFQALCRTCHDSVKKRMEGPLGGAPGADASGLPIDPTHPWCAQRRAS